tara:strand:+ start:353 stop:1135 length:783 start_codon:yes stop_codon:yes gene_type:complete
MKFSANQITALSLITGAILITLFNSLIPVNAANPFSLSFDPSVSSDVVDATMGNQVSLRIFSMLLTISSLLIPLGLLGVLRISEKDDKRKLTNWGFVLAVISITVWSLTSGANLAFAGVISGMVSTTTQLAEAQNALSGAVASKNMALVGQMTGAVTGLQMAMMSLNITAGVINAISLATHQIATTIFLLANFLVGLGMMQTKSLNSLVSKILAIFSIIGFILVLIYPVSSDPGYAIGGIILTALAILWVAKGLIIFKLK